MRMTRFRFTLRGMMEAVAIVGGGLFRLRASWERADEIILRPYSAGWSPWDRGDVVRVRLDLDRLHAYGLSGRDVMDSLTPSRMVDTGGPPPPGVVFVSRSVRPEQCEAIILKASPEGEVVRLKDVAKVEGVRAAATGGKPRP